MEFTSIFPFRFFEWQATGKGSQKQPYYIYFKKDPADGNLVKVENENEDTDSSLLGDHKQLLTMAGLFDCWKAPKVSRCKAKLQNQRIDKRS